MSIFTKILAFVFMFSGIAILANHLYQHKPSNNTHHVSTVAQFGKLQFTEDNSQHNNIILEIGVDAIAIGIILLIMIRLKI